MSIDCYANNSHEFLYVCVRVCGCVLVCVFDMAQLMYAYFKRISGNFPPQMQIQTDLSTPVPIPTPRTLCPLHSKVNAISCTQYTIHYIQDPLLITQYTVSRTEDPLPTAQYTVPNIFYPVPCTLHPAPSSNYPVHSTKYPTPFIH